MLIAFLCKLFENRTIRNKNEYAKEKTDELESSNNLSTTYLYEWQGYLHCSFYFLFLIATASFSWTSYLKETKAVVAPDKCFKQVTVI